MEQIRCPAPLPEDSATPVLTRMLVSAPYQAPAGEGEKTQDDPGSGGKSDTESGEIDLSSPEDGGGKGPSIPSPNRRKRAASEDWEGRSPKKVKMPPSIGLGLEREAIEQLQQGTSPRPNHKRIESTLIASCSIIVTKDTRNAFMHFYRLAQNFLGDPLLQGVSSQR